MEQQIPQLVELAKSAELYEMSEKVGQQFSLHIDQIGELDAEIRGIMLGVYKSADFITDIMEKLEIDREFAEKIAGVVNTEIFDVVKSKLKNSSQDKVSSQKEDLSQIEQAGNFEIEKQKEEVHTGGIGSYAKPEKINLSKNAVEGITKDETVEKIMDVGGIEIIDSHKIEEIGGNQPNKTQHYAPPPANLPGQKEIVSMTDEHTDPLVDHLLSKPTMTVRETINKKEDSAPTSTNTINSNNIDTNVKKTDPYRESLE